MKRKTVALFSLIAFTFLCLTTIVESLPIGAQEADTSRSQPIPADHSADRFECPPGRA